MTGVQKVGARVEELLDALKSGGFGPAADAAEELVGLLVGMYGDGLGQIMNVLADQPGGAAMIDALAEDPLVESLLLLHGLHPLDVDARIQRALDRVRPYLGSHAGGVEYLGVFDGIARLKLEGSCHGCPSSTVTVQLAITGAVQDAAPEVTEVKVEGMTEIGTGLADRPAPGRCCRSGRPGPVCPVGLAWRCDALVGLVGLMRLVAGSSWIALPNIGPPSSRPISASADGMAVLVCSVRGTLYAYRDACASCDSSLADGQLDRELLTCPGCGTSYNARLAGKGVDDPALHLDPLPLLADSHGVRVAVPEPVSS